MVVWKITDNLYIERTNKNSLPLKVAVLLHKRILLKINKVCRIYSMMNKEIHKKEHNKTPKSGLFGHEHFKGLPLEEEIFFYVNFDFSLTRKLSFC